MQYLIMKVDFSWYIWNLSEMIYAYIVLKNTMFLFDFRRRVRLFWITNSL